MQSKQKGDSESCIKKSNLSQQRDMQTTQQHKRHTDTNVLGVSDAHTDLCEEEIVCRGIFFNFKFSVEKAVFLKMERQ